MPKKSCTPSYCLHKPSGRAYVRLNGSTIYLGRHGSQQSRERYARVIAEWEANSRRLPQLPSQITVVEVIDRYWEYAKLRYHGGQVSGLKMALRALKDLYGQVPAVKFGPRALKAVRPAACPVSARRGSTVVGGDYAL